MLEGLAKGGDEFAALLGAIREDEIEPTAPFAGLLPSERPLAMPCEFENLHAVVQAGLVGNSRTVDFALATILLGAPFRGHLGASPSASCARKLFRLAVGVSAPESSMSLVRANCATSRRCFQTLEMRIASREPGHAAHLAENDSACDGDVVPNCTDKHAGDVPQRRAHLHD
jgi:hypothetical protein